MSPTDLRILLMKYGVTQKAIADTLDIHLSNISKVVHGTSKNPRIRRAIANAVQLSYRGVWGVEDPGVDHERPGRPVIRQSVAASGAGEAA
jgi:hypothetical protein